jgi:AcrR family transcriptional regulator
MDRNDPAVKRKRRYDSRRRALQASEARRRVLESARSLFLRNGYGATTVADVASSARVSVETVYKAFGGKPGLVQAIAETSLEGDGPVPAEARSDLLSQAEADPRTIIRGWGTLACEVAPRVAPILLLVRDAAVDPDMARLKTQLDARRLARMTSNAGRLAEAGHLRDDVTVEYAGDVMWSYSSPELFELLVMERQWPVERYGRFIADAMIAALLRPDGRLAT